MSRKEQGTVKRGSSQKLKKADVFFGVEDEDNDGDEFFSNDDDDTKEDAESNERRRKSKHAPQEISSKKPVSRYREIVETPKIARRDPRFESLSGKFNEAQFRKNYSFIDNYREQELKELGEQIKKTKNLDDAERLMKQYQSLESKLQTSKRKEFEHRVLKEYEAKERELVKQGKRPFYLKRADKRKLVLTEKFAQMKKSDVTKAIQKRRKKVASKEKKRLPLQRRSAE
ncbi:hypothetical protein V1511DRAFT_499551 [Dipodascopsis uninucleata]